MYCCWTKYTHDLWVIALFCLMWPVSLWADVSLGTLDKYHWLLNISDLKWWLNCTFGAIINLPLFYIQTVKFNLNPVGAKCISSVRTHYSFQWWLTMQTINKYCCLSDISLLTLLSVGSPSAARREILSAEILPPQPPAFPLTLYKASLHSNILP